MFIKDYVYCGSYVFSDIHVFSFWSVKLRGIRFYDNFWYPQTSRSSKLKGWYGNNNAVKFNILAPIHATSIQAFSTSDCGIYETRSSITVFTTAWRWSLSWSNPILSAPYYPISLSSISILSSHCTPEPSEWSLYFTFSIGSLYQFPVSPHSVPRHPPWAIICNSNIYVRIDAETK